MKARKAMEDGSNTVFVSSAVIWEIVIKKALGKLQAPDDITEVLEGSGFSQLPITIPHVLAVQKLPELHRDPFDRILIAQAICENLTLLTRDPQIEKYAVSHLVA
jgi:PIN domain nuclease of toxin-antitoxin system